MSSDRAAANNGQLELGGGGQTNQQPPHASHFSAVPSALMVQNCQTGFNNINNRNM